VNPERGKHLPEHKGTGLWRGSIAWLRNNPPFAWLVGLTASLLAFLAFSPSIIRLGIWHGLQAQGTLASMLLAFSLLALSLVWSTGQRIDAWAFLYFNLRGSRPPWLDWVMLAFTQIGSGVAALVTALAFFLAGGRLLAYEFTLGALTLWLVVVLLKTLVHRARPFIRLAQARIVGNPASGRSFPSGHTSQAFFMATLMIQHFHASLGVAFVLYATALLVGITRMYVGAHYPRDVLAGAILGSGWGLLAGIVDRYVQ
jgi:membrane-associated phospholipid phosphatase